LVTGPFAAGKSTVVKALSEKSISIDRMGTTVAFDYGNVNITGIEAEIFGTPGQERFEFIFKIFAREVSGVLLVIDATHPDELPRAKRCSTSSGLAFHSSCSRTSATSRERSLPPTSPVGWTFRPTLRSCPPWRRSRGASGMPF